MFEKYLNLCHKLIFSIPFILATWLFSAQTHWLFALKELIVSNMTLGCKDIGIRKKSDKDSIPFPKPQPLKSVKTVVCVCTLYE